MIAEPIFDYRGEYDENLPLPESLTFLQYRHVIFRPDAHFIDGRIVPRNLGDAIHGRTVGLLSGELNAICEVLNLSCCISLRLEISPTRIRVCDFVILAADAPYEPVPTVPPLLCIEVLAPDQPPDEELETLADYFLMGVSNIWLVDPIRRSAQIYDATGLHAAASLVLTVPDTPIRLDLNDIFRKLDQKIASHKRL